MFQLPVCNYLNAWGKVLSAYNKVTLAQVEHQNHVLYHILNIVFEQLLFIHSL